MTTLKDVEAATFTFKSFDFNQSGSWIEFRCNEIPRLSLCVFQNSAIWKVDGIAANSIDRALGALNDMGRSQNVG